MVGPPACRFTDRRAGPQIAIGVVALFFNMLYQLVAGGVLTDSAPSFVQKRPRRCASSCSC